MAIQRHSSLLIARPYDSSNLRQQTKISKHQIQSMSQQSQHPDLNEQLLDVLTNFHEGHSACKQEFQEEIVPVFKSLAETIDFSLELEQQENSVKASQLYLADYLSKKRQQFFTMIEFSQHES